MNWFKEVDFYCERLSPEIWAEPFNLVSNVFFVLVGAYSLNRFLKCSNLKNRNWLIFLAAFCIFVGIGSALFHAFANTWSLFADMLPILVFMAVYILFVMVKAFNINFVLSLAFTSLFIVTTLYIDQTSLKNYFNGSATYFPAWLVACLFAQALYPKKIVFSAKIYEATFLLGVSLLFRSIDNIFCPLIPLGTHFIWHTLNALVLFSLLRGAYLYSKPSR